MDKKAFLEEKWQKLAAHFDSRGADGNAIVAAFKYLYEMYEGGLPSWLAGLFDPEIGGFYYSNSARDNEPFRPDIESTNQAINLMVNSGMIESSKVIPEWMQKKISEFTCSLQDPDDGYIYHPQWGKDIVDSRRGRDMMWAISLGDKFSFKLPYPTANDRLRAMKEGNSDSAVKLPEHLRDSESFVKYLDSFDWEKNAYYSGNTIAAQGGQIIAAGLASVAVKYINRYQNTVSGYWSDKTDMQPGVNGFLKIASFYTSAGYPIAYAEEAALTTIKNLVSDEVGTTPCHLYNCYSSLSMIIASLKKSGTQENSEKAEHIKSLILENAPEALRKARYKTEVFKKEDGSFSYNQNHSSYKSQEAWVCVKNTKEGDVNASVLCTSGLINGIYSCLGAGDVKVPIYTSHDYDDFLNNLKIPQN